MSAIECHPEMLRLISIAWLELNEKSDRIFREFLAPIVSQILQCLTNCVKNKELCEIDPTILTAAIAASILVHSGVSRGT